MPERVAYRPTFEPYIHLFTAVTPRNKPVICLSLVMRVYLEESLRREARHETLHFQDRVTCLAVLSGRHSARKL